MPSGRRVEFRQINTNVYEAVDSSYMLLTHDPVNSVFILYTTDGTQCRFEDVTGLGDYKCVQIKDRHGNFITIDYGSLAEISTITDTLNREITFHYDEFNHLLSITQDWGGQTHTWATFAYGTQTIHTNFPGLTLNGTTNEAEESVLLRVGLADGSVYSFEYNTYCQVKTVRRYAPNNSNSVNFPGDYFQRAYTTYGLPDNANDPQTDCPRITSRTSWAYDWNPGPPATYVYGPGHAWGQVEFPDHTIYKEFFATTGWQRGLTTQTENWAGDVRKKWTTLQWAQDNTGVVYRLNPRVTETIVNDDASNLRKTTVSYASFGLPSEVKEYDADATTVLRRKHTDYDLSAVYTSRRIIGLPSAEYVYDGNDTLFSKVTYVYDLNPDPNPYLQHPGTTAQHDTANYGSGFVEGRGNLNRKLRWDVTHQDDESKASEYETGYNTSGSVVFTRDPLDHKTDVSYADSFSDGQNDRNTYAYPTTVTEPENPPSTVQYNYNFGAMTRAQDPKGAAVTRDYDEAGRIKQITNVVNGAYTKYVYAPDQRQVESFTTINDLNPANELRTVTVFDGLDRVRATASDHPGSVGGYKAQYNVYDVMGRLTQKTNPTEINGSWQAVGDDAAGWGWRGQAYDWKGRETVSYFQGYNPSLSDSQNEPYKEREIIYGGCGCAGGETVTIIEAGQMTDTGHQRRKRKVIHDALGRVKIEQVFEWESAATPYSTKTYTYDAIDRVTNIEDRAEASGVTQNTVMIYDGHSRLWKRRLPEFQDGAYQVYEYNEDDTLKKTTDARGAVGNFEYNARKQMKIADYNVPSGDHNMADAPTVNFKYDATGNMTEMDDGPGKVKYVYDTLGRLTEERRFFDTLDNPDQSVTPDQGEGDRRPFILKYEYNLSGQLRKFTDPRNDFIEYSYNKASLLTSVTGSNFAGVTNYVTGIQYRAWEAPKQASYGSGHTAASKYGIRMQIQQFDLPGVMGGTYDYNPDGRLKTMKAATDANPTAYDRRMDRSFLYDQAGRTIRTRAAQEAGLGGHPNFQFRQDYSYDAFSNMTSRGGMYWQSGGGGENVYLNTTYTNNRATTVTDAGVSQTWTYDGMGYRKKITTPDPNHPGQTITLQDSVIDAVGRIVEAGATLDGAGQVVISGDSVLHADFHRSCGVAPFRQGLVRRRGVGGFGRDASCFVVLFALDFVFKRGDRKADPSPSDKRGLSFMWRGDSFGTTR
jgi:YD repeat-containing protein